jgi:thiamine biosynthesis protein ThiC
LKERKDWERDFQMAKARSLREWCAGMPEIAVNPHLSITRVAKEKLPGGCTLCGKWCPFHIKTCRSLF